MKKTILAVVAIVLTLGVGTAFAKPQILPLVVQDPVDFVTEQMWGAINLLQDQINNFGSQTVQNTERISVLEQKPIVKTLKVYDGNNQFIGYFTSATINQYGADYNLGLFIPNLDTLVNVRSNGQIDRYPGYSIGGYSIGPVYYEGSNCTGSPFVQAQFINSSQIPLYADVSPVDNHPVRILLNDELMQNKSYLSSSIVGLSSCDNANHGTVNNARYFLVQDIQDFTGPLEIRAE